MQLTGGIELCVSKASDIDQTAPAPRAPRVPVSVDLTEIQRIRDQLMRARDDSPRVRLLYLQVAGLYQRLSKSAGIRITAP